MCLYFCHQTYDFHLVDNKSDEKKHFSLLIHWRNQLKDLRHILKDFYDLDLAPRNRTEQASKITWRLLYLAEEKNHSRITGEILLKECICIENNKKKLENGPEFVQLFKLFLLVVNDLEKKRFFTRRDSYFYALVFIFHIPSVFDSFNISVN